MNVFYFPEYATEDSCVNRLLAFNRVRQMIRTSPQAAQSAARQIVNRFCNAVSENQFRGFWSLDLLQMCTLHGGETFVLALNNRDRLNDLLTFFLNPEKLKKLSFQIKLKLFSLFQVRLTRSLNFPM